MSCVGELKYVVVNSLGADMEKTGDQIYSLMMPEERFWFSTASSCADMSSAYRVYHFYEGRKTDEMLIWSSACCYFLSILNSSNDEGWYKRAARAELHVQSRLISL